MDLALFDLQMEEAPRSYHLAPPNKASKSLLARSSCNDNQLAHFHLAKHQCASLTSNFACVKPNAKLVASSIILSYSMVASETTR